MRRFLPLLAVLLVACSGAGSAPTNGPSTATSAPSVASGATATDAPAASSPPAAEASTAPSAASSASTATTLPAACAEGLAAYLKEIEPLVKEFDPATSTLGDLLSADDAAGSKGVELLMANNATAPYSCSEVGLEWAYFDSKSPWDAVLAVAAGAAPGTVAYLTGLQAKSAMDVNPVTAYGVEGCDAAVASIKEGVAAQTSKGTSEVVEMGYDEGLALLGLYHAYMRDVQNEVCPRDALGNDEFDFMGAAG